jgi:hypothetical protein
MPAWRQLFLNSATTREELMALGREINARIGVVGGPMTREQITAGIRELHASMIAHGVKPEDNGATRELLRMRYGDDHDQDEE